MSRVASNITGNSGISHPPSRLHNLDNFTELSSLQNELTGLNALEYQMERNVETMKRLRSHAEYSRTVHGRALRSGGRLFALYCIFRTLSVRVLSHFKEIFASNEVLVNPKCSSPLPNLRAYGEWDNFLPGYHCTLSFLRDFSLTFGSSQRRKCFRNIETDRSCARRCNHS